jgi:hypothetical protein
VTDSDEMEPGTQLQEEPQEARGPMGSRDTGSDEPAGGPVDRPAGTSNEDTDSSVDAKGSESGGPDMPTGDQAG